MKQCIITVLFVCSLLNGHTQEMVTPFPAPDFVLPSAKGDTLHLSDFKGKTVLLNFWASWCEPCREENKKLAKLYHQFKNESLVIISISEDTSGVKWKKAIVNDQMKWIQLLDYTDWNRSTARRWNASVLPASFLINRYGMVIVSDAAYLLTDDPEGFKTVLRHLASQ
ncbi:TlpA family protein disulfide reductase [Niabella ginsenosidivorans]|nr:TlpA disulfide reductase family protein [Niabella ginsenosidivorans]